MTAHIVQTLMALGAIALFGLATLGAGGMLENVFRDAGSLRASERLAMRFLAGAGLIGLITFVIGQVRFSVGISLAILVSAALLNFRFPWRTGGWPHLMPGSIFAGFVVLVCAIGGLAQPIGDINSDEITYHLLGPVVWLREHRIAPVLPESHTAFPAAMEVLFAMTLGISNHRAPGLIGPLFFGALVLQVRGLAMRFGSGPRGGSLAAALLAGMPAVTSTVDQCFVDVPYAAFALAAGRVAFDASNRRHVMLAGVFAGFAAGVKYFGLPVIVFVAIVAFAFSDTRVGARLCDAILFLLCAAIAGGAWYLRNWIVLGTPIYPPPPLLWHLLPPQTFPLEASVHYKAYIVERGRGLGKGIGDLLLLPFRLTYQTAWFHGGGGMGLGPLAFGPVGFALQRNTRVARAWAALGMALTVFWFFSDQEFRFLDPAVAIYSVFAGLGCDALLRQRSLLIRWPAAIALAISLLVGCYFAVVSRSDRLVALVSPSSADVRLQQGVPHREAFAYLNSHAEVRKVLVCNPYVPAYYLRKSYTVPHGRWGELPTPGIATVTDCIGAIERLGVTHVLDVDYYGAGFQWPELGAGRLVYCENALRIYAVEQVSRNK